MEYEQHPYGEFCIAMKPDKYNDLVASIRKSGLREPIILFEGKILDGWHRYKACKATDVVPKFKEYTGDNPIEYVIDLNSVRRHLTKSQDAALALMTRKRIKAVQPDHSLAVESDSDLANRKGFTTRTLRHAKVAQRKGNLQEVIDDKVSVFPPKPKKEKVKVEEPEDVPIAPPAKVKVPVASIKNENYAITVLNEELMAENEVLKTKIHEQEEEIKALVISSEEAEGRVSGYQLKLKDCQKDMDDLEAVHDKIDAFACNSDLKSIQTLLGIDTTVYPSS